MKNHVLLLLCLLLSAFSSPAQEEARPEARLLRGKVTDESGQPLLGATVLLKAHRLGAITDGEGLFSLRLPAAASPGDTLRVSYVGYTTEEFPLASFSFLEVRLMPDIESLMEIEIVSTGYQQLPRERATGSFVQVEEELITRSVSPDILSRLDGIAPGLLLQPQAGGSRSLSIRGRSTLFASDDPLIVVDNFPYEGDISSLNPNDVESITVLRDAAAASIWGARAGNGVIVITTKGGRFRQAPQLSLFSNVTFGQQPDAFYVPRMSTADYLDTEEALFAAGYYGAYERAADRRPISPYVELLIAQRDGLVAPEVVAAERARFLQQDIRRDWEEHLYRPTLYQQHAASLRGGDARQRYYFSAGYDRNLERLVGDENERLTLNTKNSWGFFDQKLRLSTDLYFVQGRTQTNGINPQGLRQSGFDVIAPYSRLQDPAGGALALVRDLRTGFVEQAEQEGLLDWRYRPLDELQLVDKQNRLREFRANLEASYQLLPALQASLRYQYWANRQLGRDHYSAESYYARDLVNRFTQRLEDGSPSYAVPLGGILDERLRSAHSHSLRAQLNFSRQWGERHELHALGGWELRQSDTESSRFRHWGYQKEGALSAPIDGQHLPQYYQPGRLQQIPDVRGLSRLQDRFLSYYANGAYTWDRRYTASLSGRRDFSNLFGVATNQRSVPLWSAGLAWNLHEEGFWGVKALPYLKVRASWGYNGNLDRSVAALTTARLQGRSFDTGLPYAAITNPPNPQLRWEQVRILNLGLDFATPGQRLSGSLEYFQKQGRDLIGDALISPTTGLQEFRGNVSGTEGRGLDLQLSSRNLQGDFSWQTDWFLSRTLSTVTDYAADQTVYQLLQFGVFPREGYPPQEVYSIPWAGLNPDNGNPQGWLNGEASDNWSAIINGLSPDSLRYHGSAEPTLFGALRNTFSWKGFSLSANITYRLGYYFRRESIRWGNNRGLGGHGDYVYRWQQPGDEAVTQVPSIPASGNSYRDDLYLYSEALVERGDHIRLQDINLAYTLSRDRLPRLPFRQLQLYAYARNLGLLWKASRAQPDPDHRQMPAPRSLALGIRADF